MPVTNTLYLPDLAYLRLEDIREIAGEGEVVYARIDLHPDGGLSITLADDPEALPLVPVVV